MAEAFLINPARKRRAKSRKGGSTMARKRTRKRATRRRSYAAPRRHRVTSRRRYRKNPGIAELMLMNPRKRRRGRRRSNLRSKARRYSRKASRGFASVRGMLGGIVPMATEAAFIAAGGIVVSQVHARFVPDSMKTGSLKHISRAGVAVLGGFVISKFVSPKLGRAFTLGGLVDTIRVAANEYLGAAVAPLNGTMDELALGAYYAEGVSGALSAYVAPGETVESQPDFLSWEGDVPSRLDPAERL